MERICYPGAIDLSLYGKDSIEPAAFYGLPQEVVFCRKCVISNQRPNSAVEYQHTRSSRKRTIHFDHDGVCDACRFAELKRNGIDWVDRDAKLTALCDRYRRSDGRYDCIVPGSGGKDSFYASHVLKEDYGMHPLTVTWAPHIYTEWGAKNFDAWIDSGHDNYRMTPNTRVHRLLTRLSTELLFHPFQAFMLGQKAIAPRLAVMFDIPLVFYGENEAEYGNPIVDANSAVRDWSYFSASDRSKIYLGGVPLKDLHEQFGIERADLQAYLPADPDDLHKKAVEVHYLGYYLRWHPQSCYYYAVEHGGFEPSPQRTPGTYSKYNSIDDRVDDFHYHTTGVKFGIGRATYDAAQEIRSGDITRDEGVALVKRFDHEFPDRFADEIFRYLSIPPDEYPIASKMFEQPIMDREYYDRLANSFRSPHLWMYDGQWKLRHAVWHDSHTTAAATATA